MADFKKNVMDKRALGLRPYVINLVLVILFSFCILFFSINFIHVRNPTSPVYTDGRFNTSITGLNSSMNQLSDVADSVKNQLADSNPTALDYVTLIFKGAFYIPITFLSFTVSGILLVIRTLFIAFGGGVLGSIMATVLSLISSILVLTVVLLIIKSIRTGESDR